MAELIFSRDGREILRYPLTSSLRIGRHPENDLYLPDEGISRFHCRFELRGDGVRLVDQSRNGTYVNGRRIDEVLLKEGDTIELGGYRIRFETGKGAPVRETVRRKKLPDTEYGMVGKSAAMQKVFEMIRKVAPLDLPVLILGETGTGKELVARAIHGESSRRNGPLITLNCGAISAPLIESELFGHEKGAFTGALERHPGAFEQARGGTLFLDEIGELPLDLQPKLLRVLEGQGFRRVGGREEQTSDCRVIAATHRDLQQWVKEGKFREDLFFRLFTVPISLLPLRERGDDLDQLVDFFMGSLQPAGEKRVSGGALERLKNYPWKGNVRELKNVLLRALLMSQGPVIKPADLLFAEESDGGRSLQAAEREAILKALRESEGNKSQAAERLGIAKSTLFQKIKRYQIEES